MAKITDEEIQNLSHGLKEEIEQMCDSVSPVEGNCSKYWWENSAGVIYSAPFEVYACGLRLDSAKHTSVVYGENDIPDDLGLKDLRRIFLESTQELVDTLRSNYGRKIMLVWRMHPGSGWDNDYGDRRVKILMYCAFGFEGTVYQSQPDSSVDVPYFYPHQSCLFKKPEGFPVREIISIDPTILGLTVVPPGGIPLQENP